MSLPGSPLLVTSPVPFLQEKQAALVREQRLQESEPLTQIPEQHQVVSRERNVHWSPCRRASRRLKTGWALKF